ncbi:hypothetical protein SLEP1_g2263 [Rubroshorea leprosula]|uniref:Uncharacterized protein n=1 Tax=Rubroshorea leprosula TaxID=152421 RepID=A0AAV5HGK0_9ROSI|nr:hypothetical protein SLEP1_g2263 [Rubroshorea leprosula]
MNNQTIRTDFGLLEDIALSLVPKSCLLLSLCYALVNTSSFLDRLTNTIFTFRQYMLDNQTLPTEVVFQI